MGETITVWTVRLGYVVLGLNLLLITGSHGFVIYQGYINTDPEIRSAIGILAQLAVAHTILLPFCYSILSSFMDRMYSTRVSLACLACLSYLSGYTNGAMVPVLFAMSPKAAIIRMLFSFNTISMIGMLCILAIVAWQTDPVRLRNAGAKASVLEEKKDTPNSNSNPNKKKKN